VKNAAEADVDCGGLCDACPPGRDCQTDTDCAEGVCSEAFCQVPTCTDKVRNGNETGIDCGGGDCPVCANGLGCVDDVDCADHRCVALVCVAPRCTDGLLNGAESSLDCGGAECSPCAAGKDCTLGTDCMSGICVDKTCTAYACNDGARNGQESDIDCGGSNCDGCNELGHCAGPADCASKVCLSGSCVPAAPTGVALSRDGWSAKASDNYPDDNPNQVLDSTGGRWTSGQPQHDGMWFEVDMGKLRTFFSVVQRCDEAPADAPAKYDVYLSTDGKYGAPALSGLYGGTTSNAKFESARLARYVKIVLRQNLTTKWWSINELNVLE
jgi:hypothetical protein